MCKKNYEIENKNLLPNDTAPFVFFFPLWRPDHLKISLRRETNGDCWEVGREFTVDVGMQIEGKYILTSLNDQHHFIPSITFSHKFQQFFCKFHPVELFLGRKIIIDRISQAAGFTILMSIWNLGFKTRQFCRPLSVTLLLH